MICVTVWKSYHQWNLLLWMIHWMKSLLYRTIQAEVKNHSIGPALRQVMETNYTLDTLTFCGFVGAVAAEEHAPRWMRLASFVGTRCDAMFWFLVYSTSLRAKQVCFLTHLFSLFSV